MLQQTRVETVIPYYHRFLENFPTVHHLAQASRQQVLKQWEGLGYYSRVRNMQDAAIAVSEKLDGNLPGAYSDIIKLKGIGPYTASAILSIAFQKPHAVVDGNVIRVFSRYFGINEDIRKQSTKNEISGLAQSLIPDDRPGDFNQAVMELGATICTPQNPECSECPLSHGCFAYKKAMTDDIPYKSPKKKIPHHTICVGILLNGNNELLIALRPENVMLGGLWEFPGGKKKSNETHEEAVIRELKEELGIEAGILNKFMEVKHAYSHFRITLHAYLCRIENGTPEPRTSQKLKWIGIDEIDDYPFPKANKVLVEKLKKEFSKDSQNH